MAVTYRTQNGYPKGKWNNGFFFGETKLKCAWDDVDDLLLEIDGSPNWNSTAYTWGPSTAYAYDAKVEPIGRQTNSGLSTTDYQHAFVTVLYTTKGPQWIAGHGAVEETYGPFAMRVPINSKKLKWAVAPQNALNQNEIPTKIHYGQEYRVTWHQVPASPPSYWAAVTAATLAGYTNSNTVTAFTSTRTFAPETLLFSPPVVKTTYGVGKVARTTVSVSMQYWPAGWNNFWRTDKQAYQAVLTSTGAAYDQYLTAVFPSR